MQDPNAPSNRHRQFGRPLPLGPGDEIIAATPNSTWWITHDAYRRDARSEGHRRPVGSEAMMYGAWMPHVGVYLFTDEVDGLPHLRLMPPGRPPGSMGIATGAVESLMSGPIVDLE